MARTLIAVVTCLPNMKTWVQAIRETWLGMVPVTMADVRFFVGRGELPVAKDVIKLECPDEYHGLPEKVRAITRWAKESYQWMLKCDDDSVLHPIKLLTSGYEQYEYSGRSNRPGQYPYSVPFGFNYWLSKRCMQIIAESALPHDYDDERWVAEKLWDKGIRLQDDRRYMLHQEIMPPRTVYERSLRAPARLLKPVIPVEMDYFSRNIYMQDPIEVRLKEFRKVFERYVINA
jgi:hypothetical protein